MNFILARIEIYGLVKKLSKMNKNFKPENLIDLAEYCRLNNIARSTFERLSKSKKHKKNIESLLNKINEWYLEQF